MEHESVLKFQLIGGEWYWIVVGQKGSDGNSLTGGGGGGGTFFIRKPYRNPHSLAPSLYTSLLNKNTHLLLAAGGGSGAHAHSTSGPDGEGGFWDQNTPASYVSRAFSPYNDNVSDHGGASGGGGISSVGYGAGGGAGLTDSGDVSGRAQAASVGIMGKIYSITSRVDQVYRPQVVATWLQMVVLGEGGLEIIMLLVEGEVFMVVILRFHIMVEQKEEGQ